MSDVQQTEARARQRLDELDIRATIGRYFYALDAKDRPVLESCFTQDVEVQYHTGTAGQFVQNGSHDIVNYLIGNMGNYKVRTHVGANTHVVVDGDTATAVTHAVATLVKGERMVVRGLRYSDDLARIEGEWRIRRRKHAPLWQYTTQPSEPDVPAPALELSAAQRQNAAR